MTPWPICEVQATMTIMKTNASDGREDRERRDPLDAVPRVEVDAEEAEEAVDTERAAGPAPVRSFVSRRSIAAAMRSGPASWATDSRSRTTTDPTT